MESEEKSRNLMPWELGFDFLIAAAICLPMWGLLVQEQISNAPKKLEKPSPASPVDSAGKPLEP